MTTNLKQLSSELSDVVAQTAKSVVAVDGGVGHTSSGIVWRRDSILTAAHTVRQETNIRVIYAAGRSAVARLAGKDRGADFALLKLDEEIDMQAAPLSETSSLSVGQFCVAVGRTRRGNVVASAGILSGLMGEWQVARTRIDQFIRPDLNLYSGFSGGALAAADGSILGLNTTSLLRGKSITIPSSTLLRLAVEIAASGHVSRPYIGVVMQPVQIPEALQQRTGVHAGTGLLVMHIEPGGPADQGGILLGDILIEMEGRTFTEMDDVHDVLAQKGAGQDVQTVLIRGGQRSQLSIRIGERPSR